MNFYFCFCIFFFYFISFDSDARFFKLILKESRGLETHREEIFISKGEFIFETSSLSDGQNLCGEEGGLYQTVLTSLEEKKIFSEIKRILPARSSIGAEEGGADYILGEEGGVKSGRIKGPGLIQLDNLFDSYLSRVKFDSVLRLSALFSKKNQTLKISLHHFGLGQKLYLPLEGSNKNILSVIQLEHKDYSLIPLLPFKNIEMGPGKKDQEWFFHVTEKGGQKNKDLFGKLYFKTSLLNHLMPFKEDSNLKSVLKVPNLNLCVKIEKEETI